MKKIFQRVSKTQIQKKQYKHCNSVISNLLNNLFKAGLQTLVYYITNV